MRRNRSSLETERMKIVPDSQPPDDQNLLFILFISIYFYFIYFQSWPDNVSILTPLILHALPTALYLIIHLISSHLIYILG